MVTSVLTTSSRGDVRPGHAPEIAAGGVKIDPRPVAQRRVIERGEGIRLGIDDDLVHRLCRQVAEQARPVRTAIGGVGERLRRRAAAAVDCGEQDGGVGSAGGRSFLRGLLEG